ncbi:lysin [Enterobacter phage 03_vB_Eclo_IJM]|nr:lysin [Enterobacter phage 03_vB_Eclo_IJM]
MWHKQQGWLDVGYHFVIKRDGTVEEGAGRCSRVTR